MEIGKRLIGNTWFFMQLIQVEGSLDILFCCDNWSSGYLLVRNPDWTLTDVEMIFYNSDLKQWANEAWDSYEESRIWGS